LGKRTLFKIGQNGIYSYFKSKTEEDLPNIQFTCPFFRDPSPQNEEELNITQGDEEIIKILDWMRNEGVEENEDEDEFIPSDNTEELHDNQQERDDIMDATVNNDFEEGPEEELSDFEDFDQLDGLSDEKKSPKSKFKKKKKLEIYPTSQDAVLDVKSGDFVYLRSNDQKPYIGYIKSMKKETLQVMWFFRIDDPLIKSESWHLEKELFFTELEK
jgi:hypothetical protein